MKKLQIIFVVLSFLVSCVTSKQPSEINKPEDFKIVQIHYVVSPRFSFSIGEELKGLDLNQLQSELEKHHKRNPRTRYEFISELKLLEGEIQKIRLTIKRAGIQVEHFWVPTSQIDPKTLNTDKVGLVDLGPN